MSLPGTNRIAGPLFWLVFPALCVAAIVFSVIALADHLGQPSAAVHGEFTVTQRGCADHLCSVKGTFVGDETLLVELEVPGDPRWLAGRSYPAYFDRGNYEARPIAATWDPTTSVLAIAGAGTYLTVVAALAISGRRSRTVELKKPGHQVRLS